MRDTYAEYVAWETQLGKDMLALAQKEGHAPVLPELGAKPPPKRQQKNASRETVRIMKTLSMRNASTSELARVAQCTADSAGSRLSSLRRIGAVVIVEQRKREIDNPHVTKVNIWGLGPRGNEWLERYGVSNA